MVRVMARAADCFLNPLLSWRALLCDIAHPLPPHMGTFCIWCLCWISPIDICVWDSRTPGLHVWHPVLLPVCLQMLCESSVWSALAWSICKSKSFTAEGIQQQGTNGKQAENHCYRTMLMKNLIHFTFFTEFGQSF